MRDLFERYLACPSCASSLEAVGEGLRCPACRRTFPLIDGRIPSLHASMSDSAGFSMERWESLYDDGAFTETREREYRSLFQADIFRQILASLGERSRAGGVYLEIGCGLGFMGEAMAKDGWLFIGVDTSLNVLRTLVRRLDARGIRNHLLIHGDIASLPLRSGTVDLVYGGGVIEHLKDTVGVVRQIHRVLAPGGVSFNSVPMLNLGNLIYRSQWGGLPNVPVVREMAGFFHQRLLGGRHMVFGYELMFTEAQLVRVHVRAGFRKDRVTVGRMDQHTQLHAIKNARLRESLRRLCVRCRQFWPSLKAIAVKNGDAAGPRRISGTPAPRGSSARPRSP